MDNKLYTISEVANMFNLTVPTLRYYDKAGLFPMLKKENNKRFFSDFEINTVWVILTLKKHGCKIKDIYWFIKATIERASKYQLFLNSIHEHTEFMAAYIETAIKTAKQLTQQVNNYTEAIKNKSTSPEFLESIPEAVKLGCKIAADPSSINNS